jgi:hypothetical protein
MRKVMAYSTIALGLFLALYGVSEFIYIINNAQNLFNTVLRSNPDLLNAPAVKVAFGIAISQATDLKVLTYIIPGFILTAIGFGLAFLSDIIERLDSYTETGGQIMKGVVGLMSGEDDNVELTNEVQHKKEG